MEFKGVYFDSVRAFVKKYERYVSAGSIVTGFIVDSFFLVRPDEFWGNVLLSSYLVVSALGISILAFYEKRGREAPFLLLPITQFIFGNMAGSLIVLYGRSGTLNGSYLFFIFLLAFLIGNEFMRAHYARITLHISAWFFLLQAYMVLVFPIAIGRLGTGAFILSTVVSVLIAGGLLYLVHIISKVSVLKSLKGIVFSIGGIFIFFNLLYFLNVIPPVPLALRDIGIYHTIEKGGTNIFKGTYEKPRWFEFGRNTSKTFHFTEGEKAYCFSSVFAPVKIGTEVFHRFEYYDATAEKWQSSARFSFTITGGRDSGYRLYSEKTVLSGRWRCSVENERGALIGRIVFDALPGTPVKLTEKNL